MRQLERNALARLPLSYAEVERIFSQAVVASQTRTLCESHERLRMEIEGLQSMNGQPDLLEAARGIDSMDVERVISAFAAITVTRNVVSELVHKATVRKLALRLAVLVLDPGWMPPG